MSEWARWSVVFFAYLALAAEFRRGLTWRRRLFVWGAAAVGAGLAIVSARLSPRGALDVWVLPPLVLLVGYWTSGLLFVRPMRRAERALVAIDAVLRVPVIAARVPRVLAECLELAYSGVYVLVLVALLLALRHGVTPDRFWTVVLATDFVCFATMPWLQTRPPRALDAAPPWTSGWRSLNLRILKAGSVQVNTFPSGHAAEALAAALLVSAAPGWVIAVMLLNAIAVSAGAVLGRYHYAADALVGWIVATGIFYLLPSTF